MAKSVSNDWGSMELPELVNVREEIDGIVSYIKALCAAGYGDRECGRWYGVAHNVIKSIRLGKTYTYVHPYIIKQSDYSTKKPDPAKAGKRCLDSHSVLKIRELYSDGVSKSDIAKTFGVCQPTIHKIVNGKRWSNIKD